MERGYAGIVWSDEGIEDFENEAAALYDGQKLSFVISTALQSQNEAIISNALQALGQFYESVVNNRTSLSPGGQDLVRRLPGTFKLINSILTSNRFTRDFTPTALVALSLVISGAARHVQLGDRERLLQIYQRAAAVDLRRFRSKIDIEYANSLVSAILSGFTALLKAPSVGNIDRTTDPWWQKKFTRSHMDMAEKLMQGLHWRKKKVYYSFMAFLEQWNTTYDRRENILLNRRVNCIMLSYAASSSDPLFLEEVMRISKLVSEA